MGRKCMIIAGKKYGRLTAIEDAGYTKNNCRIWRCMCDCGNEAFVRAGNLNIGQITHCGSKECRKRCTNAKTEVLRKATVELGVNQGGNIYLLREKMNLSIVDFANLIGVEANLVSKYETGKFWRFSDVFVEKFNTIAPPELKMTKTEKNHSRPKMFPGFSESEIEGALKYLSLRNNSLNAG